MINTSIPNQSLLKKTDFEFELRSLSRFVLFLSGATSDKVSEPTASVYWSWLYQTKN